MRKNWEISKLSTPEYAPEFSIYSVENGKDIARTINNDSKENAYLIAAAPDLLEALIGMVERYEHQGSAALNVARSAIQKAKCEL